ncbi:unnamed protein product [marine sediment metagenome]|uniref:Uncharacterized protein n=1 Tax=marine sediment metagenome TaxID=412755 RepID=X1GPS2_9ZZZZ
MKKYEVVYQATVRGVAQVEASSVDEAEKIVQEGGRNGAALEFLKESTITAITWQALAIPARS